MTDPNNPYGPNSGNQGPDGQPSANPYGQPSAGDAYGQQSTPDPYSQQQASDPYSQQQSADPYAQQQPADPYGQPSADPYAQQQPAGPYGQPSASDQYAQQQAADPYGQQAQGHYGQQGQYAQPDPYAQGYAGPGGGPSYGGSTDLGSQGKGFFGALFDFSFSTFVTPKIIKLVYMIGTVLIGLGLVIFLISSLVTGEALAILAAIIVGPIVALIYLAIMRMTLEMYFAVVRLSEDVHHRLPKQ